MEMKLPSILKSVTIRLVMYALLFFIIAKIIEADMIKQSFKEDSLTEIMQELLIFLTAVISFYGGYLFKKNRLFLVGLGSFALVSFIRELDAFFEKYLFDKSWQLFALLVMLPTMYYLIKNRFALLKQVKKTSKSIAFGILLIGVLILHVFSRLYGRKVIWKQLLEDDYVRVVKDASEESLELLGYAIVFIATIELFKFSKKNYEKIKRKKIRKQNKKVK